MDSPATDPAFSAPWPSGGTGSGGAFHCGTAMDLVTPAVGPAAVGYSFEPEDGGAVQLPPVWRCGCGFQLDAWIRSPYARGSQAGAKIGAAVLDMPHSAALSA
ncbi:hypothetical protein [Arthrobacter sp. OY3WO11]|uniref:hypothetical protein n=1 Tax=Arthrobacter sp. OY3WO11 TaxID=1835723 RepID=UPI0012E91CFE|nr:hypothetical protein [Arthrobacter sp. OY3WO11]